MTKRNFLSELQWRLERLSEEDLDKTLEFYAEMIDDHMEEGLSEQEAVTATGDPEEIARQILGEAAGPGEQAPASGNEQTAPREKKMPLRARFAGMGGRLLALMRGSCRLAAAFLRIGLCWAAPVLAAAAFLTLGGAAVLGLVGGVACLCAGDGVLSAAEISLGLIFAGLSGLLFLCVWRAVGFAVWKSKNWKIKIRKMRRKEEDGNA